VFAVQLGSERLALKWYREAAKTGIV